MLTSQRLRAALVVVALGAVAACVPVAPSPPPPPDRSCAASPPASAADYEASFAALRAVDTEWVAADGALPVALPDGRVLWLFGDTIVGRAQADGSVADGWQFVNNSVVVQDGACLIPQLGGQRGARTDFVADPAADEWYWPSGAVVTDGGAVLRMFLMHLHVDPGPAGFEFRVVGMRVATYALPGLTPIDPPTSISIPTAPPAPAYGQTVVLGGDGYVYAYGTNDLGFFVPTEHRVARVLPGRETAVPSEWEVFDAVTQTWSSDPATATPMTFDAAAPKAPLAVVRAGTGYLAAAKIADVFSDDVSTWSGPTPTGPWTLLGRAATTGEGDVVGTFTYGGKVVLDLPGGAPIVLWSHNSTPIETVIADHRLYAPVFADPAPGSLPPP